MRHTIAVFGGALLATALCCGGTRGRVADVAESRPERTGVTAPQAESPIAPTQDATPASPSLAVSEDVIRACNLTLDNVERAPKFAFGRSELLPADAYVLTQIGDCFTTGPMKAANLRLVGRADPRGSFELNDALGLRRADEVATYLEHLGVIAGRIETRSRGKHDASGRDEPSWAIDRRVDIVLER